VTHDAKKFFSLLLKRNGYVLEQILSPLVLHTSPEHDELKAIAQQCITRHHAHHYLGFAQTQWNLFNKETPKRVKPLLYVYRVLLTGIYLMTTGRVEANLVHLNDHFKLSWLPELIDHKRLGREQSTLNRDDTVFHEQEYHRLIGVLCEAMQCTTLPGEPAGRKALSDLLVRLRMQSMTV
jgi:predicted nucleotidyltransferase